MQQTQPKQLINQISKLFQEVRNDKIRSSYHKIMDYVSYLKRIPENISNKLKKEIIKQIAREINNLFANLDEPPKKTIVKIIPEKYMNDILLEVKDDLRIRLKNAEKMGHSNYFINSEILKKMQNIFKSNTNIEPNFTQDVQLLDKSLIGKIQANPRNYTEIDRYLSRHKNERGYRPKFPLQKFAIEREMVEDFLKKKYDPVLLSKVLYIIKTCPDGDWRKNVIRRLYWKLYRLPKNVKEQMNLTSLTKPFPQFLWEYIMFYTRPEDHKFSLQKQLQEEHQKQLQRQLKTQL